MGIAGLPAIFQDKMSDLVRTLEHVRAYLDGLLVITKEIFEYHLVKIEAVLKRLQKTKLLYNAQYWAIFGGAEFSRLGELMFGFKTMFTNWGKSKRIW